MKTKLITLLAFAFFLNNYAQVIGLEKHVISTEVIGLHSIFSEDLDGDTHMDVISASWDNGNIAWFKNLDGQGNFGPLQPITTATTFAFSIFATDVDGDLDIDVLSSSSGDDKIAWYENTDGLGNFGPQQIISLNADSARGMYAADINGDGDMDVLSSSRWDHKIAWYENLGGGDFGDIATNQNIITTDAINAQCVYAEDLNGDTFVDVISGSSGDAKIAWYENIDGLGTFGPQQTITTDAEGARSVYAADLNGDTFIDVISASQDDNKIAWYANDGTGTFGLQQVLTTAAFGTRSVVAKDFDDDGDNDVVYSSQGNNRIAWFENIDGLGNFSQLKILASDASATNQIYIEDINDDGDLDVLSANYSSDETAWYEQIIILSVNEYTLVGFNVYPTPTTGILNIQSETTIVQLEIYNQLGQLVLTNKNQNAIDISSVSQGIYFIKIKDENDAFGTQKVVKK